MKKIIATKLAPGAIGPYSQAVEINGMVFLSGQIPLDPQTMKIVSGKIDEQTHQVIKNAEAVLKEVGLSLQNVVKTTCFLSNMENFNEMNEVYANYFKIDPPARSTVEVSRLPKDVLVEIEMIAMI